MDKSPRDILVLISQKLTLNDILSLATSNRSIFSLLIGRCFLESLSNYFGYPQGLTIPKLKKYEAMSHLERLLSAAEFDDVKTFERLTTLYNHEYNQVVNNSGMSDYVKAIDIATKHHSVDVFLALICFGSIGTNTIMFSYAAANNNLDMVQTLHIGSEQSNKEETDFLLLKKKNYVNAISSASGYGHYEIIKYIFSVTHFSYNVDEYNNMLEKACLSNSFKTFKLLLDHCSTKRMLDYGSFLQHSYQSVYITKFILAEYHNALLEQDLADAIMRTISVQSKDVLALLLIDPLAANLIDEVINYAIDEGNNEIVEFVKGFK